MAQADAAGLGRQAVGHQPVQEGGGAWAGHPALGEGGHVQYADMLMHMAAFLAHRGKPAGAAEGPVIFGGHALRREPVGPLPTELLAEHRALGLQPLITGRGAQGASGWALLVRVVDGEDVGVGLLVLALQIALGGVVPEAARLHAQHVDGRFAFDDPLGKLPAGPAGRGDAEAVALVQPKIGQPPSGADDGAAVRGVGNGAVIDLLDAHFGEGRHSVHGRLDVRGQALQVGGEEFVLHIVRRAIDIAAGRPLLIRPQDEAAALLAQVPGAVGLAQHPHFRQPGLLPGAHLRVWFGDDELMLHRQHGHIQADHRPGGPGVAAGGGDDVFATDVAFAGTHQPLPAAPLNGGDPSAPVNLRTRRPGALGQRLGEVRRLDVAVLGMVDGAHQTVDVTERPKLPHLLRRQEIDPHAYGAGGGRVLAVLVHALGAHRQTNVAHLPKADRLAGLRLKPLVELHRVLVDLANAVAHVEQRQEAGGMPGGAAGQLTLLQQHRLGAPALLRQVVKGADADDPAANHDNPRLRPHQSALRIPKRASAGRRRPQHSPDRLF